MKSKSVFITVAIVGIVILGAGIALAYKNANTPGKLDGFAQCLKDKGALFYGAYWCPHCQAQKRLFGKSVKKLPYVECSTPDGQGQLQVCKDNKIDGYPTWIFADGTRQSGEVSLDDLAAKSSCELPK